MNLTFQLKIRFKWLTSPELAALEENFPRPVTTICGDEVADVLVSATGLFVCPSLPNTEPDWVLTAVDVQKENFALQSIHLEYFKWLKVFP